jgi:HlyD family secretion protein
MQQAKTGPIVREASRHRPGFRRQFTTALIIVAALLIVLAAAYFFLVPKKQSFTLESYTWSTVTRTSIVETVQVAGNIGLSVTAQVAAPEPGFVQDIFFQPGQLVHAGDLIMRISPQGLQDSLDEAVTQLAGVRRSLDLLEQLRVVEKRGEERRLASLRQERADAEAAAQVAEQMKTSGFAPAAQITEAQKGAARAAAAVDGQAAAMETSALRYQFGVADAQRQVERFTSTIARLKARIAACSIRSPSFARIMSIAVSKGSVASMFAPLVTLGDPMKPMVDLRIPVGTASRVAIGQAAAISVGEKTYPGTVSEKALVADQGDQPTVGARLSFDRFPDGYTLGGQISAEITIGARPHALRLPRGPFLTTGGGLTLYRVQGNKAAQIETRIGVATTRDVEILQGVAEGDRIITSSYQEFMTFKEITLAPGGGVSGDSTEQGVQEVRPGTGEDRGPTGDRPQD